MASSVTEGHIKKLCSAGYLSSDIAHRLPDEGQLIPTPRPHERVVFLSHFLRRLGLPLRIRTSSGDLLWTENINA